MKFRYQRGANLSLAADKKLPKPQNQSPCSVRKSRAIALADNLRYCNGNGNVDFVTLFAAAARGHRAAMTVETPHELSESSL